MQWAKGGGSVEKANHNSSDKLFIWKLLNFPVIYRYFERMISRANAGSKFLEKYLPDIKGKRILDLGCKTAANSNLPGYKVYSGTKSGMRSGRIH